jgi:DNA-binding transcriptional LysR family regulator
MAATPERSVSFRRGQLRYFVAVAEEGQMARAAAKLNVAQSVLSESIAQLETALGVQLLARHARGVTPTPAGSAFLAKARVALAAATDARQTADALARAVRGKVEFGFLGFPPGLDSPGLLRALSGTYPDVDVRFRELPFPSLPFASWLGDVDVALCGVPPADPSVWAVALHAEPRVLLVPSDHPLAGRDQLAVVDALDETFIGLHPSIEPAWAGFWCLDDHRGGPPAHVTADGAANAQELLASLHAGHGITAAPARHAASVLSFLGSVVAIPLPDADPSVATLVGHKDRGNPLTELVRVLAQDLALPSREPPAVLEQARAVLARGRG